MLTAVATEAPPPAARVILRLPEVMRRTGLKKSAIYARMAARTFPLQVKLDFEAMTGLQVERVDIVRSSGPTSPPIFVRVRAEV